MRSNDPDLAMSSSAASSEAAAAAALSGAATLAALSDTATLSATTNLLAESYSAPAALTDPIGTGSSVFAPPFLSTLLPRGRSTGPLFSGAPAAAVRGSPALRPNYAALAPYAPPPPYAYDPAAYGAYYGAPYGAIYGAPYGAPYAGHGAGYGAPPAAGYGPAYAGIPRPVLHGAPPQAPPVAPQSSPAGDIVPSGAVPVPPPYDFALDVISTPPFYFSNLLPVKLKMDNYLFWRAQILPLLRSHYLEGFVDGTLPCPPPDHHMYRPWIAQDQAIL